ncbi:MAG: type II secretion system protein [Phycisphaerae bacterium]
MKLSRHVVSLSSRCAHTRGFTLVELLTVVAIIGLLIGILVPALGRAREQAKNTTTKAAMKAMGDGLDMFRNDNPGEVRGEGYPSSSVQEDETEEGRQVIFGAQLLVRYLMGKDLNGYVSKKTGKGFNTTTVDGWNQKDWYNLTPSDNRAPLARQPLYANPDQLKVVNPAEKFAVSAETSVGIGLDDKSREQLVALDNYERPILYYAANVALSSDPRSPLAMSGLSSDTRAGIYNQSDNGMFTGACDQASCRFTAWNFDNLPVDATLSAYTTPMGKFGQHTDNIPTKDSINNPVNKNTFVNFVLNRDVFEQTGGFDTASTTRIPTIVPYRKDSYIMVSAGKDGIYGTEDDVTNFK